MLCLLHYMHILIYVVFVVLHQYIDLSCVVVLHAYIDLCCVVVLHVVLHTYRCSVIHKLVKCSNLVEYFLMPSFFITHIAFHWLQYG